MAAAHEPGLDLSTYPQAPFPTPIPQPGTWKVTYLDKASVHARKIRTEMNPRSRTVSVKFDFGPRVGKRIMPGQDVHSVEEDHKLVPAMSDEEAAHGGSSRPVKMMYK